MRKVETVRATCALFGSAICNSTGNYRAPLDTLVLNAGLSLNVGDSEEQFTAEGFELTVDVSQVTLAKSIF